MGLLIFRDVEFMWFLWCDCGINVDWKLVGFVLGFGVNFDSFVNGFGVGVVVLS